MEIEGQYVTIKQHFLSKTRSMDFLIDLVIYNVWPLANWRLI